MTQNQAALPGEGLKPEKMPGHWVLAQMGKRVGAGSRSEPFSGCWWTPVGRTRGPSIAWAQRVSGLGAIGSDAERLSDAGDRRHWAGDVVLAAVALARSLSVTSSHRAESAVDCCGARVHSISRRRSKPRYVKLIAITWQKARGEG